MMMGGGGRGVTPGSVRRRETTALWGPLREIVSNRFGSVRVKVVSPSKSQGLPTARARAALHACDRGPATVVRRQSLAKLDNAG